MKEIINYIQNTPSYVLFSVAAIGFVSAGMYWRYKYYLGLKQLLRLELKKINFNFDNVLKNYLKFDEEKQALALQKHMLENILDNNDFEIKWKSSSLLRSNSALEDIYKKLKTYQLGIKTAEYDIERLKNVAKPMEDEFNSIFKEYKEKCNLNFSNEFNDNIINIHSNLENLISFLKRTEIQDSMYIEALVKKFNNYKIIKYSMLRKIENLDEICGNLVKVYDNEWRNFMNFSDKLLNNNIKIFDEEIKFINLEEKKFLDLHEDNLQFIKNYINLQNKLKTTVNIKQCLTDENIINQKNLIWENNEIHKAFDSSYENCFWLYFEIFWGDIKTKLSSPFKKSSNLNFIDSQNIELSSKFEIEFDLSDKTQFYDFFLILSVLHTKAFFFQHITNLKFLLPGFYCLIGLLVSYVLYIKLKFVYHCYKTKTLKVTFLNW
jgi:hypothetical protein